MTRTIAVDMTIPTNPVKRRLFIKYQLELRGLSFAEIARQEDVSRRAVSQVAGGGPSARLQKALADALGIPVESLFPERYDCVAVPLTQSKTTRSDAGPKGKSELKNNREAA